MLPAKYTGDKADMGLFVHFKLLMRSSYRRGHIGRYWLGRVRIALGVGLIIKPLWLRF
jgi:hypothetical protein